MIKIVAIAIICSIIIVYLKSVNSELALVATVASGTILLFFILQYVSQSIDFFNDLVELSGIDKSFYKIIFKITAIGYLVEFSATTIEDFGLKSIADKLVLAGKLMIFIISMPIIYAIFNLFTSLLQ